jgi:hypothetical protein
LRVFSNNILKNPYLGKVALPASARNECLVLTQRYAQSFWLLMGLNVSFNAEKAPFFVERLSIRTLPTLCIFIDGVLKDKVLGFQGLSGD